MMPCTFIQQVEITREATTKQSHKVFIQKKNTGVNFVYKQTENSFKKKCILVKTN